MLSFQLCERVSSLTAHRAFVRTAAPVLCSMLRPVEANFKIAVKMSDQDCGLSDRKVRNVSRAGAAAKTRRFISQRRCRHPLRARRARRCPHHRWSPRRNAAIQRAGARSRPRAPLISPPASRKASSSPRFSYFSSSRPRSGAGLYAAGKISPDVERACGCSEAS